MQLKQATALVCALRPCWTSHCKRRQARLHIAGPDKSQRCLGQAQINQV